jgi:hypothetical protein
MHALVLAIALGKIVPARTGTEHPEHCINEQQYCINEQPVICCRTPHMLQPTRKRVLDPMPLRFAQLVPTRCHTPSQTNPAIAAKTICGYRLGLLRVITATGLVCDCLRRCRARRICTSFSAAAGTRDGGRRAVGSAACKRARILAGVLEFGPDGSLRACICLGREQLD